MSEAARCFRCDGKLHRILGDGEEVCRRCLAVIIALARLELMGGPCPATLTFPGDPAVVECSLVAGHDGSHMKIVAQWPAALDAETVDA